MSEQQGDREHFFDEKWMQQAHPGSLFDQYGRRNENLSPPTPREVFEFIDSMSEVQQRHMETKLGLKTWTHSIGWGLPPHRPVGKKARRQAFYTRQKYERRARAEWIASFMWSGANDASQSLPEVPQRVAVNWDLLRRLRHVHPETNPRGILPVGQEHFYFVGVDHG